MTFNVLVVDDSVTMRAIIKKILTLTQLPLDNVWEGQNGWDGLQILRSHRVDLVLADLNMPDMTGTEMIDEMKADPRLARVPVVVVSSEADPAITENLAQKGVLDVIRKPFTAHLLRDVIVKTLGNKWGMTEAGTPEADLG